MIYLVYSLPIRNWNEKSVVSAPTFTIKVYSLPIRNWNLFNDKLPYTDEMRL